MKQIIIDYIYNVVIAALILAVGSYLYGQGEYWYYKKAPITNFFETGEMVAFDVCEGDENQNILSGRIVKGTDVGYHAQVTRELKNVAGEKVFEETVFPFAEVSNNGASTRIQQLPANLPAGEYQWTIYITLDVYGVDREVIPPMMSNVFTIKTQDECYLNDI